MRHSGMRLEPIQDRVEHGSTAVFDGVGKKVGPSKMFTVVTQFITKDGTDAGVLKEVRKLYVVGGTVIQNNNRFSRECLSTQLG
jgi:hypothetical protein